MGHDRKSKDIGTSTTISTTSSSPSDEKLAMSKPNYLLKLDLRVIPILGSMFTILFLDRTNIANARIEGLEKSLHMPSNGFNTAIWIFYIPFVLIEIPSNMIMTMPRVRPNIFLGCNMFILGIIAMCQGLTASYKGLLAIRFLMGIFEAALPAGALFIVAEYYTRTQAPLRYAMFFGFSTLGPCFSGFLATALRNMNGVQGKEGWRWIFIMEGIITVAVSFLVFFFAPDLPENNKFLAPAEKEHLLEALRADKGYEKLELKNANWLRATCDYKIWFPTLMFFCCDMTAASMASFAPTILVELGWKAGRAQAMTVPIWITGIIFQITGAFISGRTGWRFPFILLGITSVLAGWIINFHFSQHYHVSAAVRYFSLFCMSAGTFIQMAMTTSWLTSNLRGRPSMAVGTAIIFGFGNCANFVASNVFIKGEAPYYPTAFKTGLGLTVTGAILCIVYVGLLWIHNFVLEKRRRELGFEDDDKEYRYQY